MERLEDENRTVCQRLADVEVELSRKEEALKAANQKYVLCHKLHSEQTFRTCLATSLQSFLY